MGYLEEIANLSNGTIPCDVLKLFPLDIPDRLVEPLLELLDEIFGYIPHGASDCLPSCLPDWLAEICPETITDFPQVYFQTGMKIRIYHAPITFKISVVFFVHEKIKLIKG